MKSHTQRFNIALLPPEELGDQITEYAHALSKDVAMGYLLSKDAGTTSLPHVSLCHFETASLSDVHSVREGLNGITQSIQLRGLKIAYSPVQGPENDLLSLGVKKTDLLTKLQNTAAQYVRSYGLQSLTGSGENYDPHVSLSSVPSEDLSRIQLQTVPTFLSAEEYPWRIALGTRDARGQYLAEVSADFTM